jgi:hypothetical protein
LPAGLAALAGEPVLGSLAMELVAVGAGEHFGQRGVHGNGSFRLVAIGQGRRLGPGRLVAVDAEAAAAGLRDPSTSARQASMRAMI